MFIIVNNTNTILFKFYEEFFIDSGVFEGVVWIDEPNQYMEGLVKIYKLN